MGLEIPKFIQAAFAAASAAVTQTAELGPKDGAPIPRTLAVVPEAIDKSR